MQNSKFWSKRPYNSRDNTWAAWKNRNERNSLKYMGAWYSSSYAEETNNSHRNSYSSHYFSTKHLSDNDEKYPEYFTSSELQVLPEKIDGKSPLIPSLSAHSPSRKCSVSPTTSHFEPPSRVTSPQSYGALSPHSHHADVVSPRQYHSDISSPRLNHRNSSPSQYFNASPRHSSVEIPSSKRLHMDAINSPEVRFHSKSHSRETSINSQTSFASSPTRNSSFRNNSEYNRYGEHYRSWSSEKKHYRPSVYYDKRNCRNTKIYNSKSSKHSSESSPRNNQKHKLSNHCSKASNEDKPTPSAPPVEKSITNLLSKLFTENSCDQLNTMNNQNSDKCFKTQGEGISLIEENKEKNKASSTSLLLKKKKDSNCDNADIALENDQHHERNIVIKSSIENGCLPSSPETVENTFESDQKELTSKKKPLKYDTKSLHPANPLISSPPTEVSSLHNSECRGRKLKVGKNILKCAVEDHKAKLLMLSTSQQKFKVTICPNDKVSATDPVSFVFDEHDIANQKMMRSNNGKDVKINGYAFSNSQLMSSSSISSSVTKKADSCGITNSICKQQVHEKNVDDSDLEVELKSSSSESSIHYRARKSFRQKQRIIKSPDVTVKFKCPAKVTSRKQRRRHFRGGRYDLSINGQIKKKKRKTTENKSVGNDDSSGASEASLKTSNNSKASKIVHVNNATCANNFSFKNALQLSHQYGNVPSIDSILKLSLKDVLWLKLGKTQNSFVQGDENYSAFLSEKLVNSTNCRKTSLSNSSKENIERNTPSKSLGVARKTQSSSRLSFRCAQKGEQILPVCSVQQNNNNCTFEGNLKDSTEKPSEFIAKIASTQEALKVEPQPSETKSYLKNVGKNELLDVGKPFWDSSFIGEADECKKPNSGDESYIIETSSSSESDHEISFKKRKKGETKTGICDSVDETFDGVNSLDPCDIGIDTSCSKDYKTSKPLCVCLAKSLCDTSINTDDGPFSCQAVDTIDTELVSCNNKLSKSNLVRPSVKIPCIAMCDYHLSRLQQHQCCPNCGFFCTQGQFLACITMDPKTKEHQYHFFHHHCENVLENGNTAACPHCGTSSENGTVKLKLSVPHFSVSSKEFASEFKKLSKIESSDLNNCNISVDDLAKKGHLSYFPDKLQMESMLKFLAGEKFFNLRPSGKSFYGPVKSGDVDKVLYLLAMGVDPNHKFEHHNNNTPLHVAASAGYPIIVHILVQAGACVDILNNNLYTPLMLAVEKNNLRIVNYLIMCGAQLDARSDEGMTCLHLATSGGNLEISKICLESEKFDINNQDDGGWTPLVWAAEHKHHDVVKLLLEKGADPSIRDNEQNIALHWAAFSGNVNISVLILDAGCSLHAVNEHGDSPLHIAAREDNYECVMLFIARGAVPDLKNNDNKTPAMCCQGNSSESWMALTMNTSLTKWKGRKAKQNELVIHRDISRGKEDNPIQVVNGVDDEKVPSDFLYIVENCETSEINIDTNVLSLQSCKCDSDCSSKNCSCSILSFRCWYDKTGCLLPQFNMTDPPMIFECNRTCLCWKNCINRVVQHGITCRLQMFRTPNKGWGVRTLKNIPKGTFICEYVGEIISDLEADHRDDDSYLFDLDNRDTDIFCLDARHYGNISRFINHQCDPNLVPVKVFVDHQDLKFPRIAFFSARDIVANEELGFDYGEKFWAIKCKWFFCGCGSSSCKYSKDTIDDTLQRYHIRVRNEQDSVS